MAMQESESAEKTGNRKSYGGTEILTVLWVLQEYSDEDNPLSISQIEQKAAQLHGEDVVPKRKAIERCLKAIQSWSEADAAVDRAHLVGEFAKSGQAAKTAYHPLNFPAVKSKKVGNAVHYYVERHKPDQGETIDMIDNFAAFMNAISDQKSILPAELVPFEVKNRLVGAGSGTPDYERGWDPQEILAMVILLKQAIAQKKAISFFRVHYSPQKKTLDPHDKPKMEPFENAPIDENRVAKCRWPYAVKAVDGRFYVLVNASGKRDKLASFPVDNLAELHVIDPADPKDAYGEPVKLKPANRPDFDGLVERYFDGAVLGFGSSDEKVKIDLLCKGDGYHDAYKRFSDADFCTFPDSPRAREKNEEEEALRKDSKNSRQANPWVEVTFMAHPYGVERWARQRPRDVVMVSPEDNAGCIKAYLGDSRYDLGFKPLENLVKLFDLHKGVIPDDLLAVDGLAEDEKKLIAVYRNAKAKAEEEAAKKNKGKA